MKKALVRLAADTFGFVRFRDALAVLAAAACLGGAVAFADPAAKDDALTWNQNSITDNRARVRALVDELLGPETPAPPDTSDQKKTEPLSGVAAGTLSP